MHPTVQQVFWEINFIFYSIWEAQAILFISFQHENISTKLLISIVSLWSDDQIYMRINASVINLIIGSMRKVMNNCHSDLLRPKYTDQSVDKNRKFLIFDSINIHNKLLKMNIIFCSMWKGWILLFVSFQHKNIRRQKFFTGYGY